MAVSGWRRSAAVRAEGVGFFYKRLKIANEKRGPHARGVGAVIWGAELGAVGYGADPPNPSFRPPSRVVKVGAVTCGAETLYLGAVGDGAEPGVYFLKEVDQGRV